MLRITLIALILNISFVFGQQAFDNELLLLENKIYNGNSDTISTTYRIKKLDVYIKHKYYTVEAFQEAMRIDYEKIVDSTERTRFLWNASLIAHFNGDQLYASHYLNTYQKLSNDTSVQVNLLALVINNGYDSALVSKSLKQLAINSNEFDSLTCINTMYEFSIAHKKRYTVASAILPGFGSMLNGNIAKGFTSLTITGATGCAVYLMATSNLYLSALLYAYAVGAKFYFGNIALTQKVVSEKEELKKNALAKNCKCILNRVLEKYPLNFK